jgi:virulence factor Mce-like protein
VNTKPPSRGGLTALGIFVLACFCLTMFMLLTFGGAIPLQPKSWRVLVPVTDASLIARQADVRIAGVNVGKVIDRHLDSDQEHTILTLEVDPEYAPLKTSTRAVLRLKTILGEGFVELTPGSGTELLDDGDTLPEAQAGTTVRLDDFLRTFDEPTRNNLASWLIEQGKGVEGGAGEISATLAQLEPLGQYGGDVLEILQRQGDDLTTLIRDGGGSLAALTERRGQLRGLVRNAGRVFSTTAQRDRALADTFRELPPFLRETRTTVNRLAAFSGTATPLAVQLQPAARLLTPVLEESSRLAPSLKRLLVGIGPLAAASRTGLPAVGEALRPTVPLLRRLKPYLGTLIPVIDYVNEYRNELSGLFGNVGAATQATLPAADGSGPLHYARASLPINPESLAFFPKRLPSNRSNAYPRPGSYAELARGLAEFDIDSCTTGEMPTLSASIDPDQAEELQTYYFTDNPNGPTCRAQQPLGSIVGSGERYPQLEAIP